LQDWARRGWLAAHKTSRQEIADLLEVAERDLADSRTPGLSANWRLNIAYNAALQAAVAALAAAGYRPGREAHHYRTIQSLKHTIGAAAKLTNQFDQFRKKRNIGTYERTGMVSDQETREMIALAEHLKKRVVEQLRKNHPELL
jgi:uncharacterized protein (UPF0332 family)